MSKFKVGDRVRCIVEAQGSLAWGRVYTVLATQAGAIDDYVTVRDETGVEADWSDYRFELAGSTTPTLTEAEQEFRRKVILTLLERGADYQEVVDMAQTIIYECRKRGA